jgi:hypothetical protein
MWNRPVGQFEISSEDSTKEMTDWAQRLIGNH